MLRLTNGVDNFVSAPGKLRKNFLGNNDVFIQFARNVYKKSRTHVKKYNGKKIVFKTEYKYSFRSIILSLWRMYSLPYHCLIRVV